MQMPAPIRVPTFFSRRRLFEQKLADLHKCADLKQLKQLHALIYKSNLQNDPFVAPKLIAALSLCRQMGLAVNVFDQMTCPNAHLYNTLIKGYVRNDDPVKAFEVFCRMRWSGLLSDGHTYLFLLKACSGLRIVEMIHAQVEKFNLYDDLFVPNSLIDAYMKCGIEGVGLAKRVFEEMRERDVVTYNTLISGLVKVGELDTAKTVFDEMPERDRVSWNTILDGYAKAGEMSIAFGFFEKMPSRDVVAWSTVISGYAKAGDVELARMLFDKMPDKNLVTWTIMVSGYAENGFQKEAIDLFDQMVETGLLHDDGVFVSILSASAESGSITLGKRVHHCILKNEYKCGVLVNNALVDMYAKCGNLNKAWRVFNAMKSKDLISWNVMINGLAMNGDGKRALQVFDRMKKEGYTPDKVTFVGVLSACSHSGMVNDGIYYFESMKKDYNITPEIEHFGCMIDLLGRCGQLDEAFKVLQNMPFETNVVIWSSLLGACRMHNAPELAQEVQDRLVKLEGTDHGNFSTLSNIYASSGDWESVANARLLMRKTDNKSSRGVSSVELSDGFHDFTVMDTKHPKSERIYQAINGLTQHLKKSAFAPLPT